MRRVVSTHVHQVGPERRVWPRLTVFGGVVLVSALLGAPNATQAVRTTAPVSQTQSVGPARPGSAPSSPASAVLSTRVIGRSLNGHRIRAYELGDRAAAATAVVVAAQHGNETSGSSVLTALRLGSPIYGIHLWVVPRANPDGVLRGQRQNARGVDLNRNFPKNWKPITGYYYSGRHPSSEPETRVMQRFLDRVDPKFLVSFHNPLYGLDVSRAKNRPFARRLSDELHLPDKELNCSGRCHGTLSQWFNASHAGACVTVEFGPTPREHYLRVRAPRGLVRALGGHFSSS